VTNYAAIPNCLFDNAAALGLSPEEVSLICHVLRYQYNGKIPFVGIGVLSSAIGRNEKTIRNWADSLEGKGYLNKIYGHHKRIQWDFSGLWEAAEKAEPYRKNMSDKKPTLYRKDSSGKDGSIPEEYGNPYRKNMSESPTPPNKDEEDFMKKTEEVHGNGSTGIKVEGDRYFLDTGPPSDLEKLIRRFEEVSGRAPFTPKQQQMHQVPGIRQDAQVLLGRIGYERYDVIQTRVVNEQKSKGDPLPGFNAARAFVARVIRDDEKKATNSKEAELERLEAIIARNEARRGACREEAKNEAG